jgi:lantibiotic modifying enzyme
LAALVPFETADLLAGDVPLFTTRANSRAVRAYGGGEVAGFFPLSGLAAARRRIRALGEDDLERQRALIRAAFATVADDAPASCRAPARCAGPLPAATAAIAARSMPGRARRG